MQIITNNVPRYTIDGFDLPESARLEFDWMDSDELDSATFVQYRGAFYALSEFMRVPTGSDELSGWHGYHGESYFSGVVVRFPDDDFESVVMGRYLA